MLGHRQLKMEDYLKIVRRRWMLLVVPTIAVGIATYFVAKKIPDRFTSQTLVLVQEQTVPDSIVKASSNGELNQRLASMQEQILSRNSLEPLVRRYDLLSDSALPMEDKVDGLRKNIVVTPVMPMAETRANSLPGFFITVTQSNARIAQQVCSDITSMFIEKDLENRQSQATDTTKFLANTLADAKQKLDETDAKLAAMKQKYMGEMPDEEQTNLSLLASVNTQLEGVNQSISRAQQEKTIDEALITQQVEAAKQNQQGVINPETLDQQLQQAQATLAQLQSKYTDSYPDVIAKKAEIEEIKRQIAAGPGETPTVKSDGKSKDKATDAAASDKAAAPGKTSQEKTVDADASKVAASSPQLTQLRTSVQLLDQAIREKTKQQTELQKAIVGYEARLRISPLVEEQFKQLTRDYQTALDFYNSLLKQNDQATMARDLQNRQQGEMFKVLDPASLPEAPSYPNRPEIVGGGFGGGLALGLAIVLLLEIRDKSIRSEDDVEFFLKVPTLAIVPIVESMKDGKGRLLPAGGKQSPPLQAST